MYFVSIRHKIRWIQFICYTLESHMLQRGLPFRVQRQQHKIIVAKTEKINNFFCGKNNNGQYILPNTIGTVVPAK